MRLSIVTGTRYGGGKAVLLAMWLETVDVKYFGESPLELTYLRHDTSHNYEPSNAGNLQGGATSLISASRMSWQMFVTSLDFPPPCLWCAVCDRVGRRLVLCLGQSPANLRK